jgi:hypothetical protein
MSILEAPVLLIGFNRPDLLSRSLEKLGNSRRDIYISVDGPRNERDFKAVNATKDLAREFQKNQRGSGSVNLMLHDTNLGCKVAVQQAIDWIFESESKAIILEDDIFFDDDFLKTMDIWLTTYEGQKEIFHLNGFNPLAKKNEPNEAYLCRYTHVWGWATWKDRWSHYDRELQQWDPAKFRTLPGLIGQDLPDEFFTYWGAQIDLCLNGLDTWDIQWAFSQWVYGGFSLTPGSRLTGNQGFDSRATHTHKSGNKLRERLPDKNRYKFMNPSTPYLNLELNQLHDEIEHGILPKNNQVKSLKWQVKALSARVYLRIFNNAALNQIFKVTYSKFEQSKKLLKFMKDAWKFISKFIRYIYWRLIKPTAPKIAGFIMKIFKYFYWRIVRAMILRSILFIQKCFKFIYWRGIKRLVIKMTS